MSNLFELIRNNGFKCEPDSHIDKYQEIRLHKKEGMGRKDIAKLVDIDSNILKHEIYKDYALDDETITDRCFLPDKKTRDIDVVEHKTEECWMYDIYIHVQHRSKPTTIKNIPKSLVIEYIKSAIHACVIEKTMKDVDMTAEDIAAIKSLIALREAMTVL